MAVRLVAAGDRRSSFLTGWVNGFASVLPPGLKLKLERPLAQTAGRRFKAVRATAATAHEV